MAGCDARLAGYQQLLAITEAMLQLARLENWDALQALRTQQQAAVNALAPISDIPAPDLTPETRAAIAKILHSIDTANQEVIDRVRVWQGEISHILNELSTAQHNVNRLGRAYRE